MQLGRLASSGESLSFNTNGWSQQGNHIMAGLKNNVIIWFPTQVWFVLYAGSFYWLVFKCIAFRISDSYHQEGGMYQTYYSEHVHFAFLW